MGCHVLAMRWIRQDQGMKRSHSITSYSTINGYEVCSYEDHAGSGRKYFIRDADGYGLDGEYLSQERAEQAARERPRGDKT